jgi:hypothetical protein
MYPEYVLIRASRYLGCTPWELEQQPVSWRDWALLCENAETWAENERNAHELARQRSTMR